MGQLERLVYIAIVTARETEKNAKPNRTTFLRSYTVEECRG